MADNISDTSTSTPAADQPAPLRNSPSEATLLGSFDVFALIVNKMIGTGIYTAPSTVLLYTGSKQLSLGLWGVGFFYTIMRYVSTPVTSFQNIVINQLADVQ
jgi:hypothetical protein